MSKYIAIIDLPDDSKCDGCTLLSEDCCGKTGHWFRGWNYDRPTDCPLIPVDRVMEQLTDIEIAMTGDDWRANPIDSVRDILRDELEVTE